MEEIATPTLEAKEARGFGAAVELDIMIGDTHSCTHNCTHNCTHCYGMYGADSTVLLSLVIYLRN